MSLVFYEKSHRYKLDGRWVPGVTTLIKGGLPAKALMYWSARVVAEYVADNPEKIDSLRTMGRGPMVQALKETPWEKRDTAAIRGTDVHGLAERIVAGEEVEVPELLAGYVDSCVEFLDTWHPKTMHVERPVAHRAHWWAGKFDFIAILPDGRIVMIDWKTNESGIYPETAFQLAAYSHAEFYLDEDGTEQPLPDIDETWAVHLKPEGYEVIPVKGDDQTYKEFRHIAYVAGAAKRAAGDKNTPGYVGQPLEPPIREESAA